MSIAVLAACARAVRYSPSPAKLVFNAAAIGLAVLGAGHVTTPLGGPDLVRTGGAWSDPLVAVVASATYYALSAAMVAGAVALDQRRSFWRVVGGRIGVKAVSEIGLGLVGAMLAAMLLSTPNWAPMLVVPAGLLYFAKRSMDRADRRSHNLAVTSAVGRSVAGTLDPERAFESINSTASAFCHSARCPRSASTSRPKPIDPSYARPCWPRSHSCRGSSRCTASAATPWAGCPRMCAMGGSPRRRSRSARVGDQSAC